MPRRSVGAIRIWADARYRGMSTKSAAVPPPSPKRTPATINQRPRHRKLKSSSPCVQSDGARDPASITLGRVKPFSTLPNLPRGIWNMTGCSLPILNAWRRHPLRAWSRLFPPVDCSSPHLVIHLRPGLSIDPQSNLGKRSRINVNSCDREPRPFAASLRPLGPFVLGIGGPRLGQQQEQRVGGRPDVAAGPAP